MRRSATRWAVEGRAGSLAQGPDPATPRILTDPDLWATYPDWSTSGDLIVFHNARRTGEASNLHTIRPDGTGLTQITAFGREDQEATQPTWTPDGTRIIFTHIAHDPYGDGGAREAAFIDADGTNMEIVHGPWVTHPRLRSVP